LERQGYLEEYVGFWSDRPEVVRMWMSPIRLNEVNRARRC